MLAFAGAWPNTKLTDETAATWWEAALKDCDFGLGLKILERLVAHDEWFPTIARWNEARREIVRRQQESSKALPPAPADPADVKEQVARIRRMIAGLGECWGDVKKPRVMPDSEIRHDHPKQTQCSACLAEYGFEALAKAARS